MRLLSTGEAFLRYRWHFEKVLMLQGWPPHRLFRIFRK